MAAFGKRSSRIMPKSTPVAPPRVRMSDQDTVADGMAAVIPVAQLPPGTKSGYKGSYAPPALDTAETAYSMRGHVPTGRPSQGRFVVARHE